MTILLHDGTTHGGVFDRLGLVGGILGDINAIRGGAVTANVASGAAMTTRVANMLTYWAGTTDNRQVIDGIFAALSGFQSSQSGFLTTLQADCQNTVIKMADQDVALASKTITAALSLLITQMTTAAASVNASVSAAGAMTAVGSPNGTPAIVASMVDAKGVALQYPFPETLTFTVTSDSQGGATLSQEPFRVDGQASVSDTLSNLWPGGSGVTGVNLPTVDASQSNAGGNALQNSDFETVTNANIPDNWVKAVGTIGADILVSGSVAYTGSKSLEFAGDGATLSEVRQQFNTAASTSLGAGGTPYQLKPLTVYHYNFWIKMSATPAAGVLVIDLYDGSAVINDAAGTPNSKSQSLTGISTTFVKVSGAFRTPAVLSASQFLRLRLSTAIDAGKNLFIDRLGFTPAQQLYQGGPFVAAFSGATKLITGDAWTVAITNTYGGFQKLFERLFGMRALGLVIPNSGSPTVSDSLIA